MISSSKFTSAATKKTNEYLQNIGQSVGPQPILETCDQTGITQRGYQAMFKKLKTGATSTMKGLRLACLSSPQSVKNLRQEMNANFKDLVGDYYSLQCSIDIGMASKSKAKKKFTLTEHNNFFCDLEAIQRTMVQLYKITPEGTNVN